MLCLSLGPVSVRNSVQNSVVSVQHPDTRSRTQLSQSRTRQVPNFIASSKSLSVDVKPNKLMHHFAFIYSTITTLYIKPMKPIHLLPQCNMCKNELPYCFD